MKNSLQFVRPMIVAKDAGANLNVNSREATLLVANVLTTTNELCPLGFMISKGNEDLDA